MVVLALLDMADDAGDDIGIGDCADHAKFAAASGAGFDVDSEHSVEPSHPGHRRDGCYAGVFAVFGAAGRDMARHDEMAVSGVGSEQCVISDEMGARSRLPEAARRAMKSWGSNNTWVVASEKGCLSS